MTAAYLPIEPFGIQHRPLRSAFSCGTAELDMYLKTMAQKDAKTGVAFVWVLYDAEKPALAGFYTLSSASVQLAELPSEVAARIPRRALIPVVLLGRMAIDASYQGQGLGARLLMHACRKTLESKTTAIGNVGLIVDAKNVLVRGFYEKFGFLRFPDPPDGLRLILPIGTIEKLVASPRFRT